MAAELREVEELEQKALSVADEAKAMVIKDQITYEMAAEKLLAVRGLIVQINETFDPDIKRWHEGHKAAIATKKKVLGDLPLADDTLNRLISRWTAEQKRIQEENDRKEREAAAKREEEERLRLAQEAEENGASEETVTEILDTPAPQVRTIAPPTYKPVAGVSGREYWKWEITDANQIPREFLKVDDVKINGIVRAMKGQTRIPGIRVFSETSMNVRRGA